AVTVTTATTTATLGANLAGTQGLTTNGPGTLVLSTTNNYTGTTTINSGATVNAVWGGGGTFNALPLGSIVNNGALTLTRNNSDSRFKGVITGTGTTTVTGDGGYLNLGDGGDNVARLSPQGDLALTIGLNLFKNAQTIGALNGNGTITSNTGGAAAVVVLTLGNNN